MRVRLSCNHLRLPSSAGAEPIPCLLVDAVDALGLCRDGEYESVPAWRVARLLARHGRSLGGQLGRFVYRSQVLGRSEAGLDDEERLQGLLRGLEGGLLVGIRPRPDRSAAESDATRAQRRLVRQLEAHGRLVEGGRTYRLVAGVDLGGIPDRNSYEVVGRDEATRVLGVLASAGAASPESASLFAEATVKLSADWRPPLSPTGLVLLRRIVPVRVATAAPEPAVTPSQMRDLLEAEKPLEFCARFVDESGRPVTGFSGQFEHGADPAVDMPFAAAGFSRMGDRKGAREALLTLAGKAQQDLAKAFQDRWRKILGAPDEEWRQKEECLTEVLLDCENPIELVLEAGKRHTFVLRPPVALAHLHGLNFDTGRCFLLPGAKRSLKRLIDIYAKYPGWDVLVVGHADSADTEEANLTLSAERAEAMKAYLTDDVDAWLAWYDEQIPKGKRWGKVEDYAMIDALVRRFERRSPRRVLAYQRWHNAQGKKAGEGARPTPDGWQQLKEDGTMTPETRRQLVTDYMNLDGTSLPKDVRAFTYACGELYPLTKEEGEIDGEAEDGEHVDYDRRVELFLFGKPFGVLPELPGGGSAEETPRASRGDQLYPEWRIRATEQYRVEGAMREILLLDELGQPLCGAKVRVVVPTREDVEVEADDEGKIRITVPEDCEFDLVIDDIHEAGMGDSLQTESGHHFAADADGPEAET